MLIELVFVQGEHMNMEKKTKIALIMTPLIIAGLVVGLMFLGFEIEGKHGGIIWPIVLSTLGLALSIAVSYKFLKWWLK